MYFTRGNRIIYHLGDDKELIVTCVNAKFKYFVPLIELKAWRGKPIVRIDRYRSHTAIPFEFSDSPENIYKNFHDQEFVFLSKFFLEKRGSYNEIDDDYSLSGDPEKVNATSAINMWETSLFNEKYEWFVRIDNVDISPGSPT
jgi:hypothetical protein